MDQLRTFTLHENDYCAMQHFNWYHLTWRMQERYIYDATIKLPQSWLTLLSQNNMSMTDVAPWGYKWMQLDGIGLNLRLGVSKNISCSVKVQLVWDA